MGLCADCVDPTSVPGCPHKCWLEELAPRRRQHLQQPERSNSPCRPPATHSLPEPAGTRQPAPHLLALGQAAHRHLLHVALGVKVAQLDVGGQLQWPATAREWVGVARKQSGGRQRLRKRGTAVGVNQEPYLIAHRNRLHLDYAGAAGAHGLQGRGGAARSGTVGGMRGEDLAQPTTSPGPPALTLCATAILPRKRAPCSLVAAGAAIDDMAAMDDMAALDAGLQCRLM